MSGKYFMPSLGASHSHVEDVVVRYLGRNARVSECEHQGREGYYIHTSKALSKAVLEDIKSEVKHGHRSDRGSATQRARSDANPRGHLPASGLSTAIRGQSYSMRPSVIPENHAVQHIDDGLPLSRHASRAESTHPGRDCGDTDSLYGSLPSYHPSPTLSISRMATQPIAIPAGQRRSSVVSDDSSNSFDGMYGFRSPGSQSGQSCTHRYDFESTLADIGPDTAISRDRHSSYKDTQEYRRH